MNLLFVRVGIAASLLTITLSLYLILDIQNSKAQFERKIKFCELPNIEHILRLVDKDIVRQIILHFEFAIHELP